MLTVVCTSGAIARRVVQATARNDSNCQHPRTRPVAADPTSMRQWVSCSERAGGGKRQALELFNSEVVVPSESEDIHPSSARRAGTKREGHPGGKHRHRDRDTYWPWSAAAGENVDAEVVDWSRSAVLEAVCGKVRLVRHEPSRRPVPVHSPRRHSVQEALSGATIRGTRLRSPRCVGSLTISPPIQQLVQSVEDETHHAYRRSADHRARRLSDAAHHVLDHVHHSLPTLNRMLTTPRLAGSDGTLDFHAERVIGSGRPQVQEEGSSQQVSGVDLLAADLRRLRLRAESPTLVHLEQLTGVSKSSLSDAFKGKQLPSERTLDCLVRALGEDPSAWLDRRTLLASPTTKTRSAPDEPAPPTAGPQPQHALTLRGAVVLAVVAFGAGAAVATGITALVDRPEAVAATEPDPGSPSMLPVENGVDPAATSCLDDARPAASETRNESVLLEVMWSDRCQAAWGRITRYDNQSFNNSVHIEIYPQSADRDNHRQESTVEGVQSAYTALIVRSDADTRICAHGNITLNGDTIDVGDALCT
ncbi:hypothetical protein C5C36_14110 [Rathayibacter sp. AY1G1]|nr:hypothetical protein C5B98_08410 [Rathayibacter sp. AY1A5]PPF72001.1 hypothetical protein C5C46_08695 [Rathayibacter sp. AY1E6]PPH10498.1 hypothetical protein C5C36_14110 [Rathayibacter sp. AY1G1]